MSEEMPERLKLGGLKVFGYGSGVHVASRPTVDMIL
jgi:hypothetical protein